jgi:predicted acetyltransferase
MIFKVKLKNAEDFVLLDDHVYEWLSNDLHLSELKILNNLRKHSSGCAVFQKVWRKSDGGQKTETIYLHKIIAERFIPEKRLQKKWVVSAVNGDKLDCRLENLTFRPRSTVSRLRRTKSSTGYTGVYQEHQRYRAVISINGKAVHLGMYDTAEEAALAYNRASKKEFGEDGKLNKL